MKINIYTILKPIVYLGFIIIGFALLVQLNNKLDNTIQVFILHLFALVTFLYMSLRYHFLRFTSLNELSWKFTLISGLFLGLLGGTAYFTVFNFFAI